MQFGPWHAIAEAAGAAPDAPGVLQLRADELQQYPRGRSAMILYLACRPGETLRGLIEGRAQPLVARAVDAGARWIRFGVAAAPQAEGARLLDRFVERFGAAPTINQDPLVNHG